MLVCRTCQRGHCDSCMENVDGPMDCKCSAKGHPWRDANYYRLNQEHVDLSYLRGMINIRVDSDLL